MIQQNLMAWYHANKRHLPWRETQDPYLIWLSEVILQQTRIQQGLPYFLKFAQTFPQVQFMARAADDDVMKLWQGLGYYSRARNMLFTARYITNELNGRFPATYKELIKLKGVGEYTAAAIASIAFHEPVAVVDGNVFRVLSRFLGIDVPINTSSGKVIFTEQANKFLYKSEPGTFNQAMMELGSLVCTPLNPACQNCPLNSNCAARATGKITDLPVKLPAKAPIEKYYHYFYCEYNNQIAVYKRGKSDIWQNLYDLPAIVTENEFLNPEDLAKNCHEKGWCSSIVLPEEIYQTKHILTHRILHVKFYNIRLKSLTAFGLNEIWINKSEIQRLPVSRLLDKFIKR